MKKVIEVECCDVCETSTTILDNCDYCGRGFGWCCKRSSPRLGQICKECNDIGWSLNETMKRTIQSYKNKSDNQLREKVNKYKEKKRAELLERIKNRKRNKE